MSAPDRPYHHGNLRAELLRVAREEVATSGPSSLSVRALARRLGVTHAAAAHHFGGKAGLLTALAAEGFTRLAEQLRAAFDGTGEFAEVGVAYVRFAVEDAPLFDVMFRSDLYDRADAEVVAARDAAGAVLLDSAAQVADAAGGDQAKAAFAAWAYVHGIATLWRDGHAPAGLAPTAPDLAADVVRLLFQASSHASGGQPRSQA